MKAVSSPQKWRELKNLDAKFILKRKEDVHITFICRDLSFEHCVEVAKMSRDETGRKQRIPIKKKALPVLWEFLTGRTETLKPTLSPCASKKHRAPIKAHILSIDHSFLVNFGTKKLCTYRLRCEKFAVNWKRWAAECDSWAVDCRDAVPARSESHRGRNIMHTFSPSLNRTVIHSKSYFSSACSLWA